MFEMNSIAECDFVIHCVHWCDWCTAFSSLSTLRFYGCCPSNERDVDEVWFNIAFELIAEVSEMMLCKQTYPNPLTFLAQWQVELSCWIAFDVSHCSYCEERAFNYQQRLIPRPITSAPFDETIKLRRTVDFDIVRHKSFSDGETKRKKRLIRFATALLSFTTPSARCHNQQLLISWQTPDAKLKDLSRIAFWSK